MQAQVFTQSMLHSSWRNTDVRARKGFIISWMAKDVPCGFTSDRCEGLRAHFPRLAKSLKAWQPGREHIVPTEEEFIHFHSNYEPCVHPLPPSRTVLGNSNPFISYSTAQSDWF